MSEKFKLRLSKSKILDYKKCPRFFYFKYFTPYGDKAESDKPEYVYFGSLLHEYFEAYNKNLDDIDIFEKYLEKDENIRKHIHNFKEILNFYGLKKAIYSEMKLYDEELDLVGVIDAIYEKKGEYWLIDYKTGKFHKDKLNDYLFELYLYVILIERKTEMKISRIGMFFTENIYKSFVRKVEEREKKRALDKYLSIRKKILNCEYERKKSWFCKYCDFIAICEDYCDEVITK